MSDFLLELLSEEIPARMQAKARADLARLFEAELGKAGLKADAVETFSTPRRLVLIARGLPLGTPAVSEELKGPRTSAPPQALEGFLRKTGLSQDQLTDRDGIWFAVIEKPGRATTEVLAEAIPAIVRAFPWPKSMRWGAASLSTESLRWVRPLQGIVALLDAEVVEFSLDFGNIYANEVGDVRIERINTGLESGRTTLGHRFHHPGAITIGSASDYAEKLRACHVIVDQDERARLIRDGAAAAASAVGLTMVEDEGLVEENAGLTEWPVPLLGRFDPAFLDVPPEVIQLTGRVNQKYFVCHDAAGALAPAFVCVANIAAADSGAKIVEGNQKVLAARLSDARFFWEQDLKVPLAEQAQKLGQIVFHEKLGTVADKVDRVAKLARWLVEEGIVGLTRHPGEGRGPAQEKSLDPGLRRDDEGVEQLAARAERAARLCKADLVTQMVGEFPELQGLIGGYIAAAQGEDPQVAAAIRDHYKPVGQGDEIPTAAVTVAVSLADKLDTLFSFFAIGLPPTGSRDPFALRRASLGAIATLTDSVIRLSINEFGYRAVGEIAFAVGRVLSGQLGVGAGDTARYLTEYLRRKRGYHTPQFTWEPPEELRQLRKSFTHATDQVLDFLADRLKVQQREAGVRHDLIDAVFALGGEDDLVRLLARVRALQAFVETPEGRDLLAGYKRAANILKKEDWSATDAKLSYSPETAETALIAALDSAEPAAAAAISQEDFEGAMRALATLRGPVDAFFNEVIVNDPDEKKREARLNLLARIRGAVHRVADFSRIEG